MDKYKFGKNSMTGDRQSYGAHNPISTKFQTTASQKERSSFEIAKEKIEEERKLAEQQKLKELKASEKMGMYEKDNAMYAGFDMKKSVSTIREKGLDCEIRIISYEGNPTGRFDFDRKDSIYYIFGESGVPHKIGRVVEDYVQDEDGNKRIVTDKMVESLSQQYSQRVASIMAGLTDTGLFFDKTENPILERKYGTERLLLKKKVNHIIDSEKYSELYRNDFYRKIVPYELERKIDEENSILHSNMEYQERAVRFLEITKDFPLSNEYESERAHLDEILNKESAFISERICDVVTEKKFGKAESEFERLLRKVGRKNLFEDKKQERIQKREERKLNKEEQRLSKIEEKNAWLNEELEM